ncbi:hypothetical protein BIY24_10665 [Halobacteriovorax marinus]|nr:hypothetical protein BIY24_10665 [Halobacteriovorax marinus]
MRNANVYSEETFEVFKEKSDSSMLFQSQIMSRVSTGELLNITVDYKINKDYIPTLVVINKVLGNDNVVETFSFNSKNNTISYTFESSNESKTTILNTTPKFFISTPAVCTSMLYLRSKKFDTTGKNIYNVLASSNQWSYEDEPVFNAITVRRMNQSSETRTIDGSSVQGVDYKIEQQADSDDYDKDTPSLRCFVSQHVTIPYFLEDGHGTKIEVKYLNNLSERELD